MPTVNEPTRLRLEHEQVLPGIVPIGQTVDKLLDWLKPDEQQLARHNDAVVVRSNGILQRRRS